MDLREIVDFVTERNAAAAERLRSMIEAAAERVAAHPYSCRAGRISGTRECVVHPNYILIYEVHLDAVEIMSVVHSRREYPPPQD